MVVTSNHIQIERNAFFIVKMNTYSHDFREIGLLSGFYDELLNYIIDELLSLSSNSRQLTRVDIANYFSNKEKETDNVSLIIKSNTIVFTNLLFPERDNRDRFDYLNILTMLGSIHFNICSFHTYGLKLTNVECFFQDCTFLEQWQLYNTKLLENVNNVIFQSCTFNERVSSSNDRDEKVIIENSLFKDCDFKKKLELENTIFEKDLFRNTENYKANVNELYLNECAFNGKFILNNCSVNKFRAFRSEFHSKLEIKKNTFLDFKFIDSNCFKLVDAFETNFHKFIIEKSIFEDFVGFEKCQFGSINDNTEEFSAIFLYATFLSFVNFRKTDFYSGLDIEHINLKEAPNFLNANINSTNTNRETFRIIKNSFDKIGNHIDANKFFVQEMRKYKNDLKKKKVTQEKIIYFINEKFSNFGQSYIRPILWLLLVSTIYAGLIYGHQSGYLYEVYPPANELIASISNSVNFVAKHALPFKNILREGMEFVSIIFYIIMASLIWLTIVAIKRHTKR
tara:strand:+ start:22654 stop:24183 length:1530 start_codon:yes stop_codon:yes gene_type:complete